MGVGEGEVEPADREAPRRLSVRALERVLPRPRCVFAPEPEPPESTFVDRQRALRRGFRAMLSRTVVWSGEPRPRKSPVFVPFWSRDPSTLWCEPPFWRLKASESSKSRLSAVPEPKIGPQSAVPQTTPARPESSRSPTPPASSPQPAARNALSHRHAGTPARVRMAAFDRKLAIPIRGLWRPGSSSVFA